MIAAFKKLVKDYPKHDNCAEAYYWLASESEKAAATKPQAEAANEYDEAVAYFQRCIALKPKGPYADRARGRLADVYYRKGDHQNAASLILTILRSDLRSDVPPPSHLWAGEFFLESGNYDGAIEVFDLFLKKFHSASQLDPASAARLERAYFGLGDSYFRQEKWQQAIDNFAKAIALKGERLSQARLYSGIAYLKLRQNAKAVELLRIVEETAPYELVAKATYWLGNMHFDLAKAAKTQNEKIKQYAQAREKYVQVVILYKNSEVRPECMFRVAECLEQEGSVQEANQELNRLIKAYPDDEFAERARQKLGIKPAPASGQ
jgi:TolA-binding protein